MVAGPTVYLADPAYASDLEAEMSHLGLPWKQVAEAVYLVDAPAQVLGWALDTWCDVEELPIPSVAAAAEELRQRAPWWTQVPGAHYRRGSLIRDRLLKRKEKPSAFPPERAAKPQAAFLMLDRDRLLAGSRCARPFPLGRFQFIEDREGPPSRAYRKFWESLLLLGRWPVAGQRTVDCGASPGAWTWAMARLGAQVRAVDKAPIDPAVAAMPGVSETPGSAFALEPEQDGPLDWFCSDVICYPERLQRLCERWLTACERFVVTIKFQGEADPASLDWFRAQPHGVLAHVWHNKHEMMWIRHPDLPERPDPLWCRPGILPPFAAQQ
jgi:23S rRNA (cytidine2498-2'-O)-methyltransferase